MAEKENKVADNVEGKFYVDENCIACGACIDVAPDFMSMNDDAGFAFFSKQPANADEESICQEAMESCPTEAIGNDA